MAVKVPVPGPARLKRSAGPDEWLEAAKNCKYLSEYHMKQLCEIVKEFMMEGMSTNQCGKSVALLIKARIEHTTCLYPSHDLWRHPRPILRLTRAIQSRRRNARRVSTTNPCHTSERYHLRRHRTSLYNHRS